MLSYWLNTIWSFISLEGGCRGLSESTLVKLLLVPHYRMLRLILIFSLSINAARVLGRRRGRNNWFMFFLVVNLLFLYCLSLLYFFSVHVKRTCNGFVLQMAHFYSNKSIVKKSLQNITK